MNPNDFILLDKDSEKTLKQLLEEAEKSENPNLVVGPPSCDRIIIDHLISTHYIVRTDSQCGSYLGNEWCYIVKVTMEGKLYFENKKKYQRSQICVSILKLAEYVSKWINPKCMK